jgi:hypothetical protein
MTHFRKPPSNTIKAALEWNPQGTRKRGHPRTRQWTMLNELKARKEKLV